MRDGCGCASLRHRNKDLPLIDDDMRQKKVERSQRG
jgi:hypothetical protein